MPKTARLELRVEQDLLDAIDAARGDIPRARWVQRALERALQDGTAELASVARLLATFEDQSTPDDRLVTEALATVRTLL